MDKTGKKNQIEDAIQFLNENLDKKYSELIDFKSFLELVHKNPQTHFRNIFQLFYDMFKYYVGEGKDEYSGDTQSIHYMHYDFSKIFEKDSDKPFFAGRVFKNRLMKVINALISGTHQNKIYIFRGPPGSGKSIFLYNLLRKFEEYTALPEGMNYKVVWRLKNNNLNENIYNSISSDIAKKVGKLSRHNLEHSIESIADNNFFDISCPSNDHPLLIIPKEHRRAFVDDILKNEEFKYKVFTQRKYAWLFEKDACTICTSLYDALLYHYHKTEDVLNMVYAKPIKYNRRLGEGISVYNPGDIISKKGIYSDEIIQENLNYFLQDSNKVKYIFSKFARTNNGIYSLMDIKSNNKQRMIELHNIISEGIHKIEDIEESVDSLFVAILNPEDQENFENMKSFSDRIEYIEIPYILDYKTEVEIYKNQFGKYIESYFQPQILYNFAKAIISTRLNEKSQALNNWIQYPDDYDLYCDKNMQLLKMDIYSGIIPEWLSNNDLKTFTFDRRKEIIAESMDEGQKGLSGRESIKIFNDFFTKNKKEKMLINIEMLIDFFSDEQREFTEKINQGFLYSLKQLYDYNVEQQIKESLFNYNKIQISKNIKNYLFAINYDSETSVVCPFTKEKLEITEEYFLYMEEFFLKDNRSRENKKEFRRETQHEYSSNTLTKEILIKNIDIEETKLFEDLYNRYLNNLKENVLTPFYNNENIRSALKSFNSDEFQSFDHKIRNDITFLIENLQTKFKYTEKGALEICLYLIDDNSSIKIKQ